MAISGRYNDSSPKSYFFLVFHFVDGSDREIPPSLSLARGRVGAIDGREIPRENLVFSLIFAFRAKYSLFVAYYLKDPSEC